MKTNKVAVSKEIFKAMTDLLNLYKYNIPLKVEGRYDCPFCDVTELNCGECPWITLGEYSHCNDWIRPEWHSTDYDWKLLKRIHIKNDLLTKLRSQRVEMLEDWISRSILKES